MLKRILLFGLVLLTIGVILIVEFPNAEWNRALSEVVWVLSIAVFIVMLVFVAMTTARLIARIPGTSEKLPTAIEPCAAEPAPKTRWRRRLLLGLGALIAIAAFVAVLLAFIEQKIQGSDVYQISLTKAKQSADVARIVGLPVRPGWFVAGEITESTDGGGRATLGIPLDGPRGRGTLHVQAQRRGGNWRLYVLRFVSEDKNSLVDLLGQPSSERPSVP
jgi:amino acid transporter